MSPSKGLCLHCLQCSLFCLRLRTLRDPVQHVHAHWTLHMHTWLKWAANTGIHTVLSCVSFWRTLPLCLLMQDPVQRVLLYSFKITHAHIVSVRGSLGALHTSIHTLSNVSLEHCLHCLLRSCCETTQHKLMRNCFTAWPAKKSQLKSVEGPTGGLHHP